MKILFFSFYNKIDIEVHPGVGVLSTVLKKAGHKTRLYPYFYYDEKSITKEISSYKPDIIAISATSMSIFQVKRICPFIKSITNIPILLGGIFPILEPERALSIKEIDAICIGEGSKGFLEYLDGKHPATNYIYKNNKRGKYECWSDQSLDSIDYSIFWDCAERNGLKISQKLDYWTTYTCEFGCAFCCNMKIRNITKLKNKPRPSVDSVINELKILIKERNFKKIQFRDPLLIGLMDKSWVKELLIKYKSEINLPYSANLRADIFDDEIAKLLKDTGCYLIKMGLESGSEYMRNTILHKGESNEEFINVQKLVKKYNLKLSLNAMLGVPYETIETAQETIDFMNKLNPDKTFLHIYQPWPGLNIPEEITPYIKYLDYPAVGDSVVSGHLVLDYSKNCELNIDIEKLQAEIVKTPILDQPQFPYSLALELQQKFMNGRESE